MKLAYVISFCLFLNSSYSQDLYTYEKIDSTLHAWQEMFGNTPHSSDDYEGFGVIYNLDTIGYSSQDNLPIYAVKLSAHADIKEAQPRVLILGQCHAEEIYGVEIAMEIINQFLHPEQFQGNRTFLQKGLYFTEIWIVPTYNPEGLRVVHGYVEDGDEIQDVTYRKNKRDTDNNGIFDFEDGIGQDTDGVDLNRNYDFNWIFGDTLLQSCDPTVSDCSYNDDYDYYRGEYPESESETQAIVNLAREENFLLSIAYHSSRSGNVDKNVVYPWAWEGKSTIVESPGFDVISDLGDEIAELLGYSYFGGSKSRRGNAHDWLYRETGCIQYLVEVGYTDDATYGEGYLIEAGHLDEVVESNMDAFFHLLMRAAGQFYHNELLDQDFDGGNLVTGVVTDANTGLPILDAIINIPELEGEILKSRKTDSDGYYSRLLYPNQTYTLAASAYGYNTSDIINIINSASGPTNKDIQLSPSPIYDLTLNLQLPDDENMDVQLMIQNSFWSDTLFITNGEIINLPQDHYRLVFTALGYTPQVFDICLEADTEILVELSYEEVIWEANPSDNWVLSNDDEEISISLSNMTAGERLMIEINFRYELEWDYDYFIINYINGSDTTDIMRLTGDNYIYNTDYIPFTIPEEHENGYLSLYLDRDDSIDYRGIEIDYIKIMLGEQDTSGCFDSGDLNFDGALNILDIVAMANMILADEYAIIADLNEDGNVNILDIVNLVNLILYG